MRPARFFIAAFLGVIASIAAGWIAWMSGVPEDSAAIMAIFPFMVLGVGAVALVFGVVGSIGIRRWSVAALLLFAFITIGLVFAGSQRSSFRQSCYYGTGPQPAFCDTDPPSVPSHTTRFAVTGAVLGLVCVLTGLISGTAAPDSQGAETLTPGSGAVPN